MVALKVEFQIICKIRTRQNVAFPCGEHHLGIFGVTKVFLLTLTHWVPCFVVLFFLKIITVLNHVNREVSVNIRQFA